MSESAAEEQKLMLEQTGLNARQLRFVEGVEAGKSMAKAYRDAGYECAEEYSYAMASRLIRNEKIIAELDNRLFGRKRTAEQRFGGMLDGATNVYLAILKLIPGDNAQLWELQRKVAADIFDRTECKPLQKILLQHSGQIEHTLTLEDIIRHDRNNGRKLPGGSNG
jgi:hypothetical protein